MAKFFFLEFNLNSSLIRLIAKISILIAIVIIFVVLLVIYGFMNTQTVYHFKCDFESEKIVESVLGNFSKFAVAADNSICSSIGK